MNKRLWFKEYFSDFNHRLTILRKIDLKEFFFGRFGKILQLQKPANDYLHVCLLVDHFQLDGYEHKFIALGTTFHRYGTQTTFTCGQSYKQFTLVIYMSRVVKWDIFKSGTTLES